MEIEPGTKIGGGRYLVMRPAWEGPGGPAWIAHDTVLERPVLIQTFPPEAREAVSRAVAASAHVAHPGLSQIYDISTDPPGIVFEHAPGGRLSDRKDGAMPIPAAAAAVVQLAGAVAALHQQSVSHGAIGPEAVLFDEEGRAKLGNTAIASVLPDGREGYRPPKDAGEEDRDRYALAAIAYKLFTGRDPTPDAPPARTARRSVPPEVDALLARGLARDASVRPGIEEFRRVLSPLAVAAEPASERGPGFIRQEARWLAPALLLIGLGIAAVVVGVQLDVINIGGETAVDEPTTPSSPAAYTVCASCVTDFDPPPGNGEEHPDDVARTIDGKDTTTWSTVGYASGTSLDGRKEGVGLLFDLGESRPVGSILVRTPNEGWTAEWRAADRPGETAGDFERVIEFTASGEPVPVPGGRSARYWLLWITSLVDTGSESDFPYQAQVSEVRFFRD